MRLDLEELLARPRAKAPEQASVSFLVGILQTTLDRQFDAIETADRKAGILLGAILGLGILNADHLNAPHGWLILLFGLGLLGSLGSIGCALAVLWSRTLHTGPDPISSALETGWGELPFTQSVVDTLAVASAHNQDVGNVKSQWLNLAFVAAIIAVASFAALGILGGLDMTETSNSPGSGGASPAPSAAAASPTLSGTSSSAPTVPSSTPNPSTPRPGGTREFVHPRLGVAELREAWTPVNLPALEPPRTSEDRS